MLKMDFIRILTILSLLNLSLSEENINNNQNHNQHILPRPLIIEYTEKTESQLKKTLDEEEVRLECTSWRFAVEANNLSPWKTIPEECADYVKEYMTGKGYKIEVDRVSKETRVYAKSMEMSGEGNEVWVFDIDETLLSNLPYYSHHGYGLEVFNSVEFDKWVEEGTAPAIESSLKAYEEILSLGFKVFFLTGRNEQRRRVTVQNLVNAGFHHWDKLILRGTEDHGKLAIKFKSEKRKEMEEEGYKIVGNSGDQWSDLLGSSVSIRSFKLPNPMYFIS